MKELVKPRTMQEEYNEVSQFNEGCDLHCQPPETCNKHCSGQGTTNSSPMDENDILF